MDTLVSLFNLMATGSHSHSVLDSDYELLAAEFVEFIAMEISVWADYH